MKKHINIPVFVPHYGCKNACVFCDQTKISGVSAIDFEDIDRQIASVIRDVNAKYQSEKPHIEIAFFGGSFTAINIVDMLALLKISDKYCDMGSVHSVRLSTRADAIDDKILRFLKSHHVQTIELGIQSFSPKVLLACKRGHTVEQSMLACKKIKAHGFKLIGQMMCGLPLSTVDDEVKTAKQIVKLNADGARIYPAVVLDGTELAQMAKEGGYQPLTIDEAVYRSAEVFKIFANSGVPVIRIGLCANETLSSMEKSSFHSANGELVLSRYYLEKMRLLLKKQKNLKNETAVFTVKSGKISQVLGQKRSNETILVNEFKIKGIKVKQSHEIAEFDLLLEIE